MEATRMTGMTRCEMFARLMAKQLGKSYQEMTKKYWRRSNHEVWVGPENVHTVRGHCVHCARADAMAKYEG
jgi:hypothetical protein